MFYRTLRIRRDNSDGGVVRMIGDILCENVIVKSFEHFPNLKHVLFTKKILFIFKNSYFLDTKDVSVH